MFGWKCPYTSWTARKNNEWVLQTAGVETNLLLTVKEKILAYTAERKVLLEKRQHPRHNISIMRTRGRASINNVYE